LSEETAMKPKPMVEIDGYPILWHIMKIYSHYKANEFVIALGYKGEVIKEYFLRYHDYSSDLSVNLSSGNIECLNSHDENWTVHLLDTGINTETGGIYLVVSCSLIIIYPQLIAVNRIELLNYLII
tara:strand:+ start:449 stop:826 length:378 start_codon:yes stop_codon:yes gene_type:complete